MEEVKAGRELDQWISKEVLGFSVVKQKNGALVEGASQGSRPLPPYSKDIGAAWTVVEKLGITLIPIEDGTWFAMVGKGRGWSSPAEFLQYLQTAEFMESGAAVAESAALSICLAAVKAVEKRQSLAMGLSELRPGETPTH